MQKIAKSILFLCVMILVASCAYTKGTDAFAAAPLGGWAWSDNVGWVSFNSISDGSASSYAVTVRSDDYLEGYAWSDNVGWIKFDPSFTGEPGQGDNFGAKVVGSDIKGWARVCTGTISRDCKGPSRTDGWNGWIRMSGPWTNGFSFTGTKLTGFAWGSEVVGWLNSYNIERINQAPNSLSVTVPACTNTYLAQSSQTFNFKAIDGEGDQIVYIIDWGDGLSETTGASASGVTLPVTHKYTGAGTYTISVRARDTFSGSSGPATSPAVTMNVTIVPVGTPAAGTCTSGGGSNPIYAKCDVNKTNPVAYDDTVVWTASMGGVNPLSIKWSSGNTTFTESKIYKVTGTQLGPIVKMVDSTLPSRTVNLTCPSVTVLRRPINLKVKAAKTVSAFGFTSDTMDEPTETNVYVGDAGALLTIISGGMPPLSCIGSDTFDSESPLEKKLVTDPASRITIGDPYRVEKNSDKTMKFTKLGEYPYTVSCTDSTGGGSRVKKTSIIHVLPAPDFVEF